MPRQIPDEVLDCLEYSEESPSFLIWKKKFSHKSTQVNIGDIAGSLDFKRNRYIVGFGCSTYMAHRIVYFLHNPSMDNRLEIDHIDGNTANNNILNLRMANRSENRCNTKKPKSNSSGLKNIAVYVDRRNGKENVRYRVVVEKDFRQYKKIFPYTTQGLRDAIQYRDEVIYATHKEFAKIDVELSGTLQLDNNSPEGNR